MRHLHRFSPTAIATGEVPRLIMGNINTKAHWDHRFATGNWEANEGRLQTDAFARGVIPYLRISADFSGTILDFGCGLGDAIPVYRRSFPRASFIGMDLSSSAIDLCRRRFGDLATFTQGDHTAVPPVDIIIASNVFEHLSDHLEIARTLRARCCQLKIVVPYREYPAGYVPPPAAEHVNTRYEEDSFATVGSCQCEVFACTGWSEYGFKLFYHIRLLNRFRALLRLPLRLRKQQILYHLQGELARMAE